MKYKNLFLLAGIFIFNYINAQPGSSNWREALFFAPYVTGSHPAYDLFPNRQFIFDTKVIVRSSMEDNTTVDICMWLNTREGYMGILPPGRNGSGPVVEINPESPDFIFIVLGINGTAYRYYNSIGKNNILEKWVSTANTEMFVYEFPASFSSSTLQNSGEPRSYYDGQVTGVNAYMYVGSTTKLFLYGNRYPDRLHATRYFGNFGVGYLQTTEGTYLIFERQEFERFYKMKSIDPGAATFDARSYQVIENKYFTERTYDLEKERLKIIKDEARLNSGNCISERTNYLDWRKRKWMQQKGNLILIISGNLFQSREAQQAMLGSMDPLLIIQESIHKTRVSLCNNQATLSRIPTDGTAARKIPCLQNTIIELQNQEAALRAIDERFASSPGQAFAEKSKYYMQHLPRGCD